MRSFEASTSASRGITLIEILVVVAMLGVILSLALPSVSAAAVRSEMRAAAEHVQYSFDSARNMARLAGTDVTVKIDNTSPDTPHRIVVQRGKKDTEILSEYAAPAGIQLESEQAVFVFDERGLVDIEADVVLLAMADDRLREVVEVR